MALLAVSRVSTFRARIATSAPASANRTAVARPRPLLPPVISAVRPSSRISIALLSLIGEAARPLEREAEMPAKRLDGGPMVGIGVAVVGADDDHPERRVLLAGG